jgi:hypothetical protein
MAEKQTFTYYLNIEIEAMNEESAMKKLEGWVEPTLALKKNADLELTSVEYDEPEGEEEESPEEEKPSLVKSAMKGRSRPALNIPEKDDFDYDNIPDWEEIEEDKPKKAKSIVLEETDDLDGLLDGLEDDDEESEDDDDDSSDDDGDDDDWDWDAEEKW